MRISDHARDRNSAINGAGKQSKTFVCPRETPEEKPSSPIILARSEYLGAIVAEVDPITIMHDGGTPFALFEMNASQPGRCWPADETS